MSRIALLDRDKDKEKWITPTALLFGATQSNMLYCANSPLTWQAGWMLVDESSSATFTVTASSGSYGDRIANALREMREITEHTLGNRLVGTTVRRIVVTGDDGDRVSKSVFAVETEGTSPIDRADLVDSLFDYLIEHKDKEIRADVSVEVY